MSDLDKRVKELEDRVKSLEKIENRRKSLKTASILIKLFIFSFIVVALWYGYTYVRKTYIKPYKEKIDTIEEKYNSLKNFNFSNLIK
jgi:hypothetical protein